MNGLTFLRHVIAESTTWNELRHLFRSPRLIVLKHATSPVDWKRNSGGQYPDNLPFARAPCDLDIVKGVAASTISNLLASPLHWNHEHGESRQRITAIGSVGLVYPEKSQALSILLSDILARKHVRLPSLHSSGRAPLPNSPTTWTSWYA